MTTIKYELFDTDPEYRTTLKSVQFKLLSDEEKRSISACTITTKTLYSKNLPQTGGPLDPRMGVTDRRLRCCTCGHDMLHCAGHFGHIELPFPVYHVSYVDDLAKLLNCICFFCSRLRIYKTLDNIPPKPKTKCLKKTCVISQKYLTLCNNVSKLDVVCKKVLCCPHCGGPQPQFSKDGKLSVKCVWPPSTSFDSVKEQQFAHQPFSASVARNMLEIVSEDDLAFMGFESTHPKDFIMQVLLVVPPYVRPSIQDHVANSRGSHDFTDKYVTVLRKMEEWHRTPNGNDRDRLVIEDKVQEEIATLMWNKIGGLQSKQRSGLPTASLFEYMSGKRGRFRKNLMGKRVNFSSRTVITPDPTLDIDQIAIPKEVAMKLTYPETVNTLNYMDLLRAVGKGPHHYGGANRVLKKSSGATIHLRYMTPIKRERIRLEIGDVVERHLRNNDWVVMNRQPTLHKHGMMGHRVVVRNGVMSFGLNPACCKPYNADFDGDEMNLHVPQSEMARAEVMTLMASALHIVSPAKSKTIIKPIQDCVVGVYLLTADKCWLDAQTASIMWMEVEYPQQHIQTILW